MRDRPGAAGLLAALCLAIGGCGEGDEAAPDPGSQAGAERWERIVRTMPARLEPGSANPCGRGTAACIEEVTAEMERRLAELAAACDHNAPFALMYLRVTEGVGENGAVSFEDPRYLNHLDAVFAELYFDAYDSWRSGRPEEVPEAWRIALAAADDREASTLGDMLLGMNAHISRDLPLALVDTGLSGADGRSAKDDFDRVNGLLADVQEPMIEEQAERFDPGVAKATLPALEVDAEGLGELMTRWRTEAWQNARRLLAANGAARAALAVEIEDAAAGRAQLISALTSDLVLGPGSDERDAYCEERS